jgi:phosphinothricin acetyltransferase
MAVPNEKQSREEPERPAAIAIRNCEEKDLPAVTEIYRHHVLTSPATFELEPPGPEEMLARYRAIVNGGFVYLVAEQDARIVGYAYVSIYRARPAYRFTVEDSVYIRPGNERRGVGRMLLQALLAECERRPFRQVIAVIGDSANTASIELHRALGFRMVGNFRSVGYKFGRWLDSVLMQKEIGAGDAGPGKSDAPG